VRSIGEYLGGLWQLLRLALVHRARLNGPYWRWRAETAFGSDRANWPAPRDRRRAIRTFARWVHRMRRDL